MALAGFFLFLVRLAAQGYGGVAEGPPVYFYLFAGIAIAGAVGVVCQPRPVYAALYFVLVTLAGAGLFVLLLAEFMAIVLIIIYAGAILVTYVFVIMLASQGSSGGNVAAPAYDRRAAGSCAAILVSFVLAGAAVQALLPRRATVIDAQWGAGTSWINVTKAVQAKAVDGRLDFAVRGLSTTDPAPGQAKELKLTYQLEGLPVRTQTYAAETHVSIDHLFSKADSAPKSSPAALMANSEEASSTVTNVQVLGTSLYSQYGISLELAGILLTIALIGAVVIARKNTQEHQPLGTGAVPSE